VHDCARCRIPAGLAHERRRPTFHDVARASSSLKRPFERGSDNRHHLIPAGDCLIHHCELGQRADRVPVVLLHGLNDWHLTWRRVAPALARDRRVLLPDLPGHGLSSRPDASYTLGWYAEVMARWLAALDLEQVDLVGHSLGGGIAQMLLLECPRRIRRLVLACSGGLGREIAVVLRLASIPLVVERFGQPFMGPGTRLALKSIRDVLPPTHIAELSAINAQTGSARAFARTVRDIIDWRGQRRHFLQRAHEIAALPPIAVLWGERDTIIPATHATALAEWVDGVHLQLFAGCGHYLQHEQPEALAQSVRQFLDAASVPPARLRSAARANPASPRAD
jgi:pimeloyl-ACP methyl ester carboxylesterase